MRGAEEERVRGVPLLTAQGIGKRVFFILMVGGGAGGVGDVKNKQARCTGKSWRGWVLAARVQQRRRW